MPVPRSIRTAAIPVVSFFQSAWLGYPKHVECNICGWAGRHFASDKWHPHINCPKCRAKLRQRLFAAALQNLEEVGFRRTIEGKRVLHFAPEPIIRSVVQPKAATYTTADFLRKDCDLSIDMSDMPEVASGSFDTVMAFDVMEHVPDYRKALAEIRRVLSPAGYAILTVPQKDGLAVTDEDPLVTSPAERKKRFGQWDHLRIFGDDFPSVILETGFDVLPVDASMFGEAIRSKHVLAPIRFSMHPLATNNRKVFFCRKAGSGES